MSRVLSGMRPTGPLHIGHYLGALGNWFRLQDEYECFFIIADLHTLTTRPDRSNIVDMENNIPEMILDYLAVGIDPERSLRGRLLHRQIRSDKCPIHGVCEGNGSSGARSSAGPQDTRGAGASPGRFRELEGRQGIL